MLVLSHYWRGKCLTTVRFPCFPFFSLSVAHASACRGRRSPCGRWVPRFYISLEGLEKNSTICDLLRRIGWTKWGSVAREQPRFLTIPLNPHFPLPGPSKCAQCFIYPMQGGNKEPYPFCFLKKSAVIENKGRDGGDSHMSLRKNYKSQQARWWKRTSCPQFQQTRSRRLGYEIKK